MVGILDDGDNNHLFEQAHMSSSTAFRNSNVETKQVTVILKIGDNSPKRNIESIDDAITHSDNQAATKYNVATNTKSVAKTPHSAEAVKELEK